MLGFTNEDIKLILLSGNAFVVDGIELIPYTLKEITSIGYSKYNYHLGFFSIDLLSSLNVSDDEEIKDIKEFDVIIYSTKEILDTCIEGLKFFLRKDEIFFKDEVIYVGSPIDGSVINRDNYDDIKRVIQYQDCLKDVTANDEREIKVNDKAREILNKLRKAKEVVERIKSGESDNEPISFYDIVSSVSTKSNALNKVNIWDLNMYQLIDEYKRLNVIENFDIGVQSMLQGAKDVKLKHWSKGI